MVSLHVTFRALAGCYAAWRMGVVALGWWREGRCATALGLLVADVALVAVLGGVTWSECVTGEMSAATMAGSVALGLGIGVLAIRAELAIRARSDDRPQDVPADESESEG